MSWPASGRAGGALRWGHRSHVPWHTRPQIQEVLRRLSRLVAMGVLLYEALWPRPPEAKNEAHLFEAILDDEVVYPTWTPWDPPSFMAENPTMCLGSLMRGRERAVVRHPFLKEMDWAQLNHRQLAPPFRPGSKSREDVGNFDPGCCCCCGGRVLSMMVCPCGSCGVPVADCMFQGFRKELNPVMCTLDSYSLYGPGDTKDQHG